MDQTSLDTSTPVDAVADSSAKLIGQHLVSRGILQVPQLNAALAEQKITQERLGIILTRLQFVTRQDLVESILATKPQNLHSDSTISNRVPAERLLALKTMVVAETATQAFLATLTSERQVRRELAQYYGKTQIVFVAANHEQLNDYLDNLRALTEDDGSLLEKMLQKAFIDEVSDIHIEPGYNSYAVWNRVHGVRHQVRVGTLDEYNTVTARIKDQAGLDLAERRLPQDGKFSMEYNGKLVDMRVATVPTKSGEKVVLRLLDPDRVQPHLHKLGITFVDEWRKGVSRPSGLCLICGPTGSGKTTTLNASIKELDRFGKAIYTLEDPVEYGIPYVSQVNVNNALGLDFAKGIRAFMRNDPDVIVVGEIRDTETALNAIKAAETGHLVLGTLHTGTIYGAVQRLKDLGVPVHELTYLLRTVLVQRLLRTYCSHCDGAGHIEAVNAQTGELEKHTCLSCDGTGYRGRTIVSECAYFPDEEAVAGLLEGKKTWSIMEEDAVQKQLQGITSRDEVIRMFGEPAAALYRKMED